MTLDRRQFLSSLSAAGSLALVSPALQAAPKAPAISCNQYNWITFYERDGKKWMSDPDASMADFLKSGLRAYEPSFNQAEEVRRLAPYIQKYKLEMQSVYVGSTLHREDESQKSIEAMLAIAEAAKPLGTRIIVSNPSPVKWGSPVNKSDAELMLQARNLDKVGAELRRMGMTLAYHTHDPELRAAAREFHHMLLATDPRNVALCLDAHWIFRGAENSQVALFDIVKLYGKRIVEVHIRQSQNGVWSETFGPGDIDYPRLVRELNALKVNPLLVLEQCVEKASPKTMDGIEAHRKGLAYARELFGS